MSAEPDCSPQHQPSISAHRLIGNGRSALLLRPDAEIDWWCAPELDSAPVCWSLLDPGGGRAVFRDVRYARRSAEPAGRTAHTELATASGRIGVRDGLLDDGIAGVTLVRLVRAVDTELDVQHELCLAKFGSDAGPDRDVSGVIAALDAADADERARLSGFRPPNTHRERALDALRVLRAWHLRGYRRHRCRANPGPA